jgi:hypothetical protein
MHENERRTIWDVLTNAGADPCSGGVPSPR